MSIPTAESGPDGKILPAPETNQIAGFVEFRPLTHWEKKKEDYPRFEQFSGKPIIKQKYLTKMLRWKRH